MLENEGKLSLNDPIRKYISEFPVYSEGEIEIKHLIHHTSGIRDYNRLLDLEGHNDFTDNEMALYVLLKQKSLNFKPGSKFSYNNSNYFLLAEIVKRISNMSFSEFIKKRIFTPLNMNDTFVYEDYERVIKNRASAYVRSKNNFKISQYDKEVVVGAGGICTSLNDYLKWMNHLWKNKLNDEKFLTKLTRNGSLDNGQKLTYAFGIGDYKYKGIRALTHNGSWGGYNTNFFMLPDESLSIVIFSNYRKYNLDMKMNQIMGIFLKDKFKTPKITNTSNKEVQIETKHELSQEVLEKYAGLYLIDTFIENQRKKIELRDGKLYYFSDIDNTKNGVELIAISENEFKLIKSIYNVKFTFNDTNQSLRISNNDYNIAQNYTKYIPVETTDSYLDQFVGEYFCEEIDMIQKIKRNGQNLFKYVNGPKGLKLSILKENWFTGDNDLIKFFEFYKNDADEVIGFRFNEMLNRNLNFKKLNSN